MKKIPVQNINVNLLLVFYFFLKMFPMFISCLSIYLGYKLFVLGVSGEASLSVDAKTVSGQLLNAAPGLFFAVGGIVALIISIWKGVKIDFATPIDDLNNTLLSNITFHEKL